MMTRTSWMLAAVAICAACVMPGARAATPEAVSIAVFTPPSLGSVLTSVIKQQKFDLANDVDITFAALPPDAYSVEFNSGQLEVGGSASVLMQALASTRGVKTTYLFNLFDYWGAVVTNRADIKTLADLQGREIAAAKGTTNYTMFEWFAQQQGVKTSSFKVINTATAGLVAYALADRAEAVELWEPAYSLVLSRRPGIHTVDLNIPTVWSRFAASERIPNLGVAAHRDWIAAHKELVPRIYRAYAAAAAWVVANPVEAASFISSSTDPADRKAIADMVREKTRLAMDVLPAAAMRREIEATYRMGLEAGLLTTMPDDATIYDQDLR